MTALRSSLDPGAAEADVAATTRVRLRPVWALLPVSIALWALGVSQTRAGHLGPYGLPAELPVVFYVGVALVVLSASIELARARLSRVWMAMHAVALVVILYGTAALVYPEGRYSWLYKTVGVVQYVNSHGRLDSHIDIYQNWPGFFALAAWFDKVAGVASPLAYAKWAQLFFELAALPLLYLAYKALALPPRQRWIAMLLYSAANPIGQDYFSPQALGTVLGLGVVAFALRWMYAGNRTAQSDGLGPPGADSADEEPASARAWHRLAPLIVVITGVFFVLTFSHELSPYLVAVQLAVLALAGLVRPRWLPFVLAAIAFGYLLPRLGYVNEHYGLLQSFGDFFRNLRPPALAAGGPLPASQELIERCAEALTLGMWALALVGAWLRRRSRRTVLTLLVLAYSPIVILAAVPYGNEGILRVYLFSLPWTAALAAAVLAPLPEIGRRHARRLVSAADERTARVGAVPIAARPAAALVVALALFFPAFFGDDTSNVMLPSEVAAVTAFLKTARPGPVFAAVDNSPLSDARYNLFPVAQIFGRVGVLGKPQVGKSVAAILARTAQRFTHNGTPAYVVITPSMIAYNLAYPATAQESFTVLRSSLDHSPDWKLILNWQGTIIYEMPPHAPNPGAGPIGVGGFGVP
jgi:hypothetical protein